MSTRVGVADEYIESDDISEHKSPGADTDCASQRLLLGVRDDGTEVERPHFYRLLIPLRLLVILASRHLLLLPGLKLST
jgi:hypothetical protein